MTCPVCRGETDPRALLLEPLCERHLAEVKPLSDDEIRAAIEEGQRHVEALRQSMPGGNMNPGGPGGRFR